MVSTLAMLGSFDDEVGAFLSSEEEEEDCAAAGPGSPARAAEPAPEPAPEPGGWGRSPPTLVEACVRCLARNLQRVGVLVALAVEAAWMLPLFCCIDNYR
jgi:hypothetical protein